MEGFKFISRTQLNRHCRRRPLNSLCRKYKCFGGNYYMFNTNFLFSDKICKKEEKKKYCAKKEKSVEYKNYNMIKEIAWKIWH